MTLNRLLLEVMLRPDWRAHTLQAAARRLRLWRATEIAVATATLAVVFIGPLLAPGSWGLTQRAIVYTALFWLIPPILVYSARQGSPRFALWAPAAALSLLLAIAIALVTVPIMTFDVAEPILLALVGLLALAAWPALIRMSQRYPVQARQAGLTWEGWPVKVLAGTAAGLALGFHLWITGSALPILPHRPDLSLGAVLWTALVLAGLVALSQELFFRGWSYHLLFHRSTPVQPASASAKLVLLNLLAYAGLATAMPTLGALVWTLGYGALLALATTFLRYRLHSLLPGLACNVVSSLFVASLVAGL